MRVAIGLKTHSGWAALIAIGDLDGKLSLVDGRRVDLVSNPDSWHQKQPYHAAEKLPPKAAETLVLNALEETSRIAVEQLRRRVDEFSKEHKVVGIGIVTPSPMPAWSVSEILAVHMRMHKAEGIMYPHALAGAARKIEIPVAAVNEKTVDADLSRLLGRRAARQSIDLTSIGKQAGPPWGKDQKLASLSALIALRQVA